MLSKLRYFLVLLTVLVLIVVAFQNQQPVDVTLLFFSGRYSLTLLLLSTALLSFLVGSLLTFWRMRKRKSSPVKPTDQADEPAKAERPAKPETDLNPRADPEEPFSN